MKGITRVSILIAIFLITTGCQLELPEKDSKAAKLYQKKCSLCHPPPHPAILSPRGWERIAPKMDKRAADAGLREAMTEEEMAAVIEYLKRHARERAF